MVEITEQACRFLCQARRLIANSRRLVEVLEDEAPGSVGLEEGGENKGLHSHELDEDVE